MVEKLIFWLEGIVEDTPLPDEINVIVFTVKQNGEYKFLDLKGYQNEPNVNASCFYPLEAQFFNCQTITKLPIEIFYKQIKNLIDEAFSSLILKQNFKGRKIYVYRNKYEYLFTV